MDYFQLGGLVLRWDGGGYQLLPGRYMERFRCPPHTPGERVCFCGCLTPLESYLRCPPVRENAVYATFDVGGERLLVYHWGNNRFAFAVWPERIDAARENVCLFDPDMLRQPGLNADWFFGVSGLHRALLQRGAPILHASYISWQGHAVLFSAPSGTGKSTQAGLWAQHAGAEIVNGDRVLLRKRDDRWYAFGYPCCGSSQICLNRTLPLRAIVLLRQGAENAVEELPAARQVQALAGAIEVYPWDSEEIGRALDLEIPVIRLTCRPDGDAVDTLKRYLEGQYATDL